MGGEVEGLQWPLAHISCYRYIDLLNQKIQQLSMKLQLIKTVIEIQKELNLLDGFLKMSAVTLSEVCNCMRNWVVLINVSNYIN